MAIPYRNALFFNSKESRGQKNNRGLVLRPDAFSNIFFSMLKMAEKFQRWNFFDIFGGKIKIGFTGREEVKQS